MVSTQPNTRRTRFEVELPALQTVLDTLEEGIVLLDKTGQVTTANRAVESLLGISRETMVGQKLWFCLPNPHREEIAKAFDTVREANGKIQQENLRFRYRGRVLRLLMRTIQRQEGGTARIIAIISDVSEAERILRMESSFVSTVSHELRTPLTAIQGALQLMKRLMSPSNSGVDQELIEISLNNTERLIRLVDGILDISAIESGLMSMEAQPLLLGDLVDKSIASLASLAADKHIEIDADIHTDRFLIIGDRDRLIQVLTNLISNAVRFSPPGEHVTVAARRIQRSSGPEGSADRFGSDGEWVETCIIDHGAGIPAEEMGRLFTPFHRISSRTHSGHQGTGLGLAISRAIVEQHGGTMRAESKEGEGSRFCFILPAASSDTQYMDS